MPLKVELRPGERLIVGKSVITNSDQRTRLTIDGKQPILRESDILTHDKADTPAKLIYLAIQLMYLEGDYQALSKEYFNLINAVATETPESLPLIDAINNEILTGSLYKALKAAKRLVQFEQERDSNAKSGGSGLPADGPTDSSPKGS